jgi:hypothetical protein
VAFPFPLHPVERCATGWIDETIEEEKRKQKREREMQILPNRVQFAEMRSATGVPPSAIRNAERERAVAQGWG